MQDETRSKTSTYQLTIYWAKPNLSFSQSPSCHIPTMNVRSHETNPTKPNQGFQRPSHLNPQPMIPPQGQMSLTITRLVSTQVVKGSRAFVPTKASKTSNSTHICCRASRVFVKLGLLGLITQPTKGFQSTCPTKAFWTSNSTQVVTRFSKCLSNQGFQALVTQPTSIRIMRTNQKTKGKTPTTPWLSRKWQGQENPPSI